MQVKPIEVNLTVQQQENVPLWIKAFERIMDMWKNHNINHAFSIDIDIHSELPNETWLSKLDLSDHMQLQDVAESAGVPLFYAAIKTNLEGRDVIVQFFFGLRKCGIVSWYEGGGFHDSVHAKWREFMKKYGYDVKKDKSLDGGCSYYGVDNNYALKVLRDWTEFMTKQDMQVAPTD